MSLDNLKRVSLTLRLHVSNLGGVCKYANDIYSSNQYATSKKNN